MFPTGIINKAEKIESILHESGSFHDSRLESFKYLVRQDKLIFAVDDLFSNFEGLEGYKGPAPGQINFYGISALKIDIEIIDRPFAIYDIYLKNNKNITLKLSPAGQISFNFDSMEVINNG